MLKEINVKVVKLSNNAGYKYKISKEDLLQVFTDKKWIDETIDLINDNNLINNNKNLDGDDENLKLIGGLKLQLEEAQNKIKELETKKNKKKIKKVVEVTEE